VAPAGKTVAKMREAAQWPTSSRRDSAFLTPRGDANAGPDEERLKRKALVERILKALSTAALEPTVL